MAHTMKVSLVAADREVWSGEATVVNARTLAGEIGIMANHTPIMSVLDEGQVDVRTVDDGHWVAAIDGGFISVAHNEVRLLCEHAEISHESNYEEAKRLLEEAKARSAAANSGSPERGSMSGWQWLLDSAGVALLVFICYGLLLVVRRRVLSRHGGTFELSVRVRSSEAGRGWVLGLGRYREERLEWFRIFSPSPRPRRTWQRALLEITGQREASGAEAFALYSGHVVVECRTPSGPVELAMSPSALTGFSSWLESGPPGSDWDRRRVQ